jgi:AcrR family transcriptional regulator
MNLEIFIHGARGMEDRKAKLYESAKALFSEIGFKDTGVADIARRAGVAVGTFYLYFPSKDALFIEIFKDENERMLRGAMDGLNLDGDPKEIIRALLAGNMRGMMESPILRQWYDPASFAKIERLFRAQDGLTAAEFLYRDFFALVKKWQAEGRMRADIDAKMIMAMFGGIIRIGHHREEIGAEYFPALQEYMTEFILDSLARHGGNPA